MSQSQSVVPARSTRAGQIILRELDARAWDVLDLACLSGLDIEVVRALVSGRHRMTPEIADALGGAFGMSDQFWLRIR